MIDKVNISNFKSLQEVNDLGAKPITVLCGINSCGKSSFLESLLFLKQNIENNNHAGILYNGEYVRLGNYRNIIFRHDVDNLLRIEYDFSSLDASVIQPIVDVVKREGVEKDYSESIVKLIVGLAYRGDDSQAINDALINYFRFEFECGSDYSYFEIKEENQVYKLSYNLQVPYRTENITLGSSKKKKKLKDKIKRTTVKLDGATFNGLLPDASSVYESLQKDVYLDKIGGPRRELENAGVNRFMTATNTILLRLFRSICYIGPLREEPSRKYIYENEINGVGVNGANAAYLLHIYGKTILEGLHFYDETSKNFVSEDSQSLAEAVEKWMEYLGVKSFNTSMKDQVIQVSLKDSNTKETDVSIADVGFGISQVFPFILEGLRIGKGSTLILEQPEIHLHPKLQMQIGDYMIAMALSGRNFLIETHSDHLVNRLVRRIVEDESGELVKLVQIYFVTNSLDGASFEEIEINDTQGIVNWPEGFFDQSANEQELIIRAGLKKRKKHRKEMIEREGK